MLREQNIEKLEKLPKSLKKVAKETFKLACIDNSLHYSELMNVLNRIGIELDNQEFKVFLKDCEMEDDDTISYSSFIQGLERLFQDQNTKPKVIVCDVLKHNLKNKKIKIEDLADFLEKNKWFMQDADIRDFLMELHLHLDENGMIDLDEIEFSN